MVKLDNWQTKAEKAVERRIATKQRKQQRDKTRSNKALSQKLLGMMDHYHSKMIANGSIATSSSPLEVHVWTDIPPKKTLSSTILEEEMIEFKTPEKKKGRPRSNSDVSYMSSSSPQSGSKKGRPRSNSDVNYIATPQSGGFANKKNGRARSNSESNNSCGRKKGRPRSLSNASDSQDGDEPTARMCCHHFFGKCSSGGRNFRRKGSGSSSDRHGCACGEHPMDRTLYTVLVGGTKQSSNNDSSKQSMGKCQAATLW